MYVCLLYLFQIQLKIPELQKQVCLFSLLNHAIAH